MDKGRSLTAFFYGVLSGIEFTCQSLEYRQRLFRYMVLNALRIPLRAFFINADGY